MDGIQEEVKVVLVKVASNSSKLLFSSSCLLM